jgi:hypothetical protein
MAWETEEVGKREVNEDTFSTFAMRETSSRASLYVYWSFKPPGPDSLIGSRSFLSV